jgi:hypothetical protein
MSTEIKATINEGEAMAGGVAPANNVGSGNIKGTGGAGGEPGVQPKWMRKYKRENEANAPKSPVMGGMQTRKTLTAFRQGK